MRHSANVPLGRRVAARGRGGRVAGDRDELRLGTVDRRELGNGLRAERGLVGEDVERVAAIEDRRHVVAHYGTTTLAWPGLLRSASSASACWFHSSSAVLCTPVGAPADASAGSLSVVVSPASVEKPHETPPR